MAMRWHPARSRVVLNRNSELFCPRKSKGDAPLPNCERSAATSPSSASQLGKSLPFVSAILCLLVLRGVGDNLSQVLSLSGIRWRREVRISAARPLSPPAETGSTGLTHEIAFEVESRASCKAGKKMSEGFTQHEGCQ